MDRERMTFSTTCPDCGSTLMRAAHPAARVISECDQCEQRFIFNDSEWQPSDKPYQGSPPLQDIPKRVEELERFINDHEPEQQ